MNSENKLYNDDILGFVVRVDRFLAEVNKSLSANITDYGAFDITRLKSYIAAMRTYLSWVSGQPQLDLPDTHPQELVIPVLPELPDTENPMAADVIRLLTRLRSEMIKSQSARMPSGFVEHDLVRSQAIIDKIEKFVIDYIEKVTPMDLPESSPSTPVTGHGM